MKLIGHKRLLPGFCTLLLIMTVTACAGKVPASHYYSLYTIEQLDPGTVPIAALDVALGIGAVLVPDQLKRPQIATQSGPGQYHFNEFHRWAGLLENNIAAVLGGNLGRLLGTDRVGLSPWPPYFKPDYRVSVEVIRFDGNLSGDVVLNARWFIGNAAGDRLLASGRSETRLPLDTPAFKSLVSAESRALAALSRTIADQILVLHN